MILRRTQRRALRVIERNLADSDPRLDELFLVFTEGAGGAEIPGAEKMRSARLRKLLRRGPRPGRHQAGEDGRAQPWAFFLEVRPIGSGDAEVPRSRSRGSLRT
jgi:hypothetical protein